MAKKKRVLLKISGELFKSGDQSIDMQAVLEVAQSIANLTKKYGVAVVVGGGNIFRGRSAQHLNLEQNISHTTGMLATLVNSLALKNAFDKLAISHKIVSAIYCPQISKVNLLDSPTYIDQGNLLIFAGGTGNPYVSTDTASVIRALEIKAEAVFKATHVSGVFSADPHIYKSAKQFKKMSYDDFFKLKDNHILDTTAVNLAKTNNLPIYIFKWHPKKLAKAVNFKAKGTIIKN